LTFEVEEREAHTGTWVGREDLGPNFPSVALSKTSSEWKRVCGGLMTRQTALNPTASGTSQDDSSAGMGSDPTSA
jgi:hypothetical protein